MEEEKMRNRNAREKRKEKSREKLTEEEFKKRDDDNTPERAPLLINNKDVSPELSSALLPILELAGTKLWRWKTFPIILPQPVNPQTESVGTGSTRRKTINMKDLFVEPNFNELDAVSTDSKGEPKKLNNLQLESIQQTGEFEVESVQFAGQKHTWRLNQVLQKGSQQSTLTLRRDLARALHLLVVTAREGLVGEGLSVLNSKKGWTDGFRSLADFLIGLPSMRTTNLQQRLMEERQQYLVCELVSPLSGSLDQLAAFVRRLIVKSSREKGSLKGEKAPHINFIFQTPQGKEIDLRLFSVDVMKKALPIVSRIVEMETKGWFPEFKEKVLSQLKTEYKDTRTLQAEANKCVQDEYLKRVSTSILQNLELRSIGLGIPELLVDQLRAGVVFQQALEAAEQKLEDHLQAAERGLQIRHPILSQIPDWVARRLNKFKIEYLEDEEWEPHLLALRLCREQNLVQHAYFLSRDHTFLKDQEHVLLQELGLYCRSPTHSFKFQIQIWNPTNWVTTETYKGTTQIIPTVVHKHTGKSSFRQHSSSDDPVYLVEKQTVITNTTQYPFWRWSNFIYRTWTWSWNLLFILLILVPWCSTFSLRSLLYLQSFYPDLEISHQDGSLHRKASSITPTLNSRLRDLWKHIAKSREEFENQPDRGLLGKSITRHYNRFVNYILKGCLGTVLIIFLFPTLCILVSGLSLTLALLTPVLVPTLSLVVHLLGAVFYDFETGSPTLALLPNLVWNIGIRGVLQPAVAVLVSCVLCPLSSMFIAVLAVLRKGFRTVWDTVMFELLIKKRAKVPFIDTFVARRISGPGMSSSYFYQIKTEQALVALESKMEVEELEAFQIEMEKMITAPQEDYKKFISNLLTPFGVSLSKPNPGPFNKKLETETSNLLNSLTTKVENRKNQLRLSLSESTRSRIKLTERELKLALGRGAAMAQRFYPGHVISREGQGYQAFWESRQLRPEDWVGLVSNLYSEIFSPDFLCPMQDTDTVFNLKVEHWNLTRYLNMVMESDWHDDLDVAKAVHTPKGNISLQAPVLDVSLFNPMKELYLGSTINFEKWRNNISKVSLVPRLPVPLPVPHPALVSIIIYNRESENPLNLDSSRSILSEVAGYSQPMSTEYLLLTEEEEQEKEEKEGGSLGSRDSMYEMGSLMDSLSHSVEHLDTQITLVQSTKRSSSVESSLLHHHTQYNVRSEINAGKLRQSPNNSFNGSRYTPGSERRVTCSQGSLASARIASAEDVRLDDFIEPKHTAV